MKPGTGDEAMGRSNRRTSRGERGQRAGTDQPRNLGDPAWEQRGKRGDRQREYITASGPSQESERPIVARKSGNADGAKGPCWKQAEVRGKENRLGEPTTEGPEARDANSATGMPEKLSWLRQKLQQKAKQEPKFRFYVL
jgi:hypothetical protein